MSDQDHARLMPSVGRRGILQAAGVGTLASVLTGLRPRTGWGADAPTLVTSIRSLSNPYHAVWKQGADAFAKSVGLNNVTLVSEGNSEKSIADIRAMIAKTGGNMVLNCDPNDTPDARPVVEACAKAHAYVTTQWNKPTDLHPWDFNPYYVAHIEFNGVRSGREIAEQLFKAMGGKGGFVALGGMISTTAAIERRRGLNEAVAANPGIKLLDFQTADWKSQQAYDITSGWVTRFGDQIKGIWAANDDMGSGALEALRAEGLAGKVPVVGIDGIKAAVDAVQTGEFVCTITSDPYWQGGIGLALGLAAKRGVIDPTKEPHLHREFYAQVTEITKANVADYVKTNVQTHPVMNWSDLWGRVVGPIVYS